MDKRAFRMELKDVQPETGTFVGYLSTFGNTDAQGDVVERGAFSRTLDRWKQKGKPIPLLWQHSEVVGGIDARDASEDDHGLFVKGKLVMELQKSKEVLALLKAGIVNAMSIGYDVIQQAREGGVRKLKELRLYEGSLVLWPANENAEVIAVKKKQPDDENAALGDALGAVIDQAHQFLKAATTEVQSVIFPKKHWDDADECKKWLKSHDFKSGDVDETSTSWRFRQSDPGKYDRMRTVCLTPAGTSPGPDCRIEAIMGIVSKSEITSSASNTEYSPVTTTVDTTLAVKQTEDRALSAEIRAKLKEAIEALTPLLAESDSPNAAEGDSQEPGTDTPTPDPGEIPSEDEDAKELLTMVRELADNLRRKGP